VPYHLTNEQKSYIALPVAKYKPTSHELSMSVRPPYRGLGQVCDESEASNRCAVAAARGCSLGRGVSNILRRVRRISLVQYDMSVMKKMLIAGIAALLMATPSPVHATERLPQKMLGVWCIKDETELMNTYVRKNCKDPLTIWADGYTEEDGECELDEITKVDTDVYLVHSYCKFPAGTATRGEVTNEGGQSDTGNVRGGTSEEWQLMNGQLKITSVPEV
jgi:hypothetical protein